MLRLSTVYAGPIKGALDREATYSYYMHGPLMRTEIGDLSVQGVDFAYTLHGWIKGVNSGTLKSDRDIGRDGEGGSDNKMVARDVYGYSLGYFRSDYTAIGQSAGDLTTTDYFMPALPTNSNYHSTVPEIWNGNIRHMITAIKPFMGASGEPQGMAYGYDQLNRIVSARAWNSIDADGNTWETGGSALDKYKENYTYDGNGNILSLNRYAVTGAGAARAMDSFNYHYIAGTNQLEYVTDTVNAAAFSVDIDNQDPHNYAYDEIGNLVRDSSEEIDTIQWNVYGKIKSVSRFASSTKPDLEFEYDPMGNRVLKRVITKGGSPRTIETLYIRDASGNEIASYTMAGDSVTWNSASIYGSARLGLYEQDQLLEVDSASQLTLPDDEDIVWRGYRKYELSNHLGNVLVVISDKRTTVCGGEDNVLYYEAEIVSAQDYYPFGMVMVGRDYASVEYKLGFNGKLKDIESSTYDYGFRIYNPSLSRFLSVDPLFRSYPWYTPYQFAGNKVIQCIDLDGLEEFNATLKLYEDGYVIVILTLSERSINNQIPHQINIITAENEDGTTAKIDQFGNGYIKDWVNQTRFSRAGDFGGPKDLEDASSDLVIWAYGTNPESSESGTDAPTWLVKLEAKYSINTITVDKPIVAAVNDKWASVTDGVSVERQANFTVDQTSKSIPLQGYINCFENANDITITNLTTGENFSYANQTGLIDVASLGINVNGGDNISISVKPSPETDPNNDGWDYSITYTPTEDKTTIDFKKVDR